MPVGYEPLNSCGVLMVLLLEKLDAVTFQAPGL